MRLAVKSIILMLLVSVPLTLNAQVLISLIFGDALNTDKIEFGLAGGLNRSYILTIDEAKGLNNFNLGFYFHIQLNPNAYISTGVHVKSNVGATGMPTYSLGNDAFDSLYQEGTLTKKIPVFYVPIMYQQRFNNRWYIEGGPQLGLIHKPKDIFETDAVGGDLVFTQTVQDGYKRIDFGLTAGVGYKFKQQIKSMAVGINYYYGLVNVSKTPDLVIKNSTIFFYAKIPIGAGKSEDSTQKP